MLVGPANILAGATIASGGLAAGIAASGLSALAATAVGAVGEGVISGVSGSLLRLSQGYDVTWDTVALDTVFGAALGAVAGRLIGGPRVQLSMVAELFKNSLSYTLHLCSARGHDPTEGHPARLQQSRNGDNHYTSLRGDALVEASFRLGTNVAGKAGIAIATGGGSLAARSSGRVATVAAESVGGRQMLYHYTNEAGAAGILESGSINPSLWRVGTKDVRYGNGQYVSDIVPGIKTPAQLSREFLGQPFQGNRFTHYVEIDATELGAVQGRPGVYVVPNEVPLDLTGRLLTSGKVPGQ